MFDQSNNSQYMCNWQHDVVILSLLICDQYIWHLPIFSYRTFCSRRSIQIYISQKPTFIYSKQTYQKYLSCISQIYIYIIMLLPYSIQVIDSQFRPEVEFATTNMINKSFTTAIITHYICLLSVIFHMSAFPLPLSSFYQPICYHSCETTSVVIASYSAMSSLS